MKCPECNLDNPEGMKFCGHCGAPLSSVCQNCNHSNPVHFKSCGNCGNLLTPSRAFDALTKIQKYIPTYLAEKILQSSDGIEGERKTVTVVFADISGFTAMAETRDPEEARAVAIICHTMLGRIVYKYEGVVDKIMGDGLMAIFGVPTHEDDPERALLAAMEMRRGMMNLSQELSKNLDVSLGLSIGVNTGVVIIGDVGTGALLDYTVIGDVVNTASRLQEEAKSDEILVTDGTYKKVAHCFDFQTLAPLMARGRKQPVQVYKLIQRKEEALKVRGIEGLRAPLIGRDREFDECRQTVVQLIAGEGGALLITGEAGLGKSRLVEELKQCAESRRITWLEGKCISHSRSINYWVFIDALRDYFDLKSKTEPEEIEKELRKREAMRNIGENTISIITSLLSSKLETEKNSDDLAEVERKLRVFAAVRDVLAAECSFSPLILVLEDLHWTDELSMELLVFLIKELSQDRIVFICVYRSEMGELDISPLRRLEEECLHSPPSSSVKCSKIALTPLSDVDSNLLLESLLSWAAPSYETKSLVLGKAGGNPLYLEEVIRSIIDGTAVEHRAGKMVRELEDIEVPDTIQGVIMARIDGLSEEPKRVLQCASIIGLSFEYELLSYLTAGGMTSTSSQSSRTDEANPPRSDLWMTLDMEATRLVSEVHGQTLDECLEKLEDMGFISRGRGGKGTIRFKHVLTQEVAYSTILKKRRRELHESVCHYIEETHRDHIDEFCEILAYHYANSNDIESALSYLTKAGNKNRQSSTGSAENALRYFDKALEILDGYSLAHDKRAVYEQNVYSGMGEAYKDLGNWKEALSSFKKVLQVAEQREDHHLKAGALRQIANSKAQMVDLEGALEAFEESLAIARKLDDLPQMGFVFTGIGYVCFERGEFDESMRHFHEALRIGRQSGDLRLVGDASNGIGIIASMRHDFDEAIQYYQTSLCSYVAANEDHYKAQTYLNLGIAYFKKGRAKVADRYYRESLKISEKCGYTVLMTHTYLNISELYIWKSNLDKAMEFCEKAFRILHKLDDKWACAEGYKLYGMIYRRQREIPLAEKSFQTSLELSKECNYLHKMAEVYCEMGLMYREENMLKETLKHFDKAKEAFEELRIEDEVQRIEEYISEI